MTVSDQLRILDNKTKQNQVQLNLAKISALSSGNLHKYDYLTGVVKVKI